MSRILFINSVCNGSTGTICKNLYKAAKEAGHTCCIAYGRGNAPEGFNTIKIGNQLDIYLHVLKARLFDASGFGSKKATKDLIKQIEELGYKGSMYQDREYVVITDIFIKQKEAHQQAKEIAEKGNTCVVKEYFIDDRYQKKIEKKEYNAIYQFLKTN